jgi:hypothetical protein
MYDAVRIAGYNNKDEAQSAGRVLESEGIPFLIKAEAEAPAPDPLTSGATIYVAPDIAKRAKRVLGLEEDEPIN